MSFCPLSLLRSPGSGIVCVIESWVGWFGLEGKLLIGDRQANPPDFIWEADVRRRGARDAILRGESVERNKEVERVEAGVVGRFCEFHARSV